MAYEAYLQESGTGHYLLEDGSGIYILETSTGSAPVATPATQDAGSKRHLVLKRERYVLRVDGEEYVCRSLADALSLLERAKALAKKLAQARMKEATSSKRRTKPLPVPKIEGSEEIKAAVAEAEKEIKAIYRSANMDLELMLLLHSEISRQEDEDLMWLM